MRVCLDTNVLVSGIYWGGIPGKILECWVEGHFELMISPEILQEYARILRQLGMNLGSEDPEKWLSAITAKSSLVTAVSEPRRWSRDVKDDKFVDCALAGKAQYLVTGDQDLLELRSITDVKIVTPRQFLSLK